MKKSLLFALAAVAMLCACNNKEEKADKSSEATTSDNTETLAVECVTSGDVVYIDVDYIMASSKLYAAEGKALETKMQEFQTRAVTTQDGWVQKEQSIASEYNKLQKDAVKIQEDYQKGLITTLSYQQKMEELAKKEQSIVTRGNSLQTNAQKEGEQLAKDEQTLAEEQIVLMNRFQELTRKALEEINADKRYKMILNAASVIDADPTLNISSIVLEKVDELYEAGALE